MTRRGAARRRFSMFVCVWSLEVFIRAVAIIYKDFTRNLAGAIML